MTEEQKIKRAKELYGDLVYPKTHIELYVDGYLAGAKELETQIADIKANCDLAIEGRDIKIKELELELTVEKDQHQEEVELHLHAEEYIKSLEKENAELKAKVTAIRNAKDKYDMSKDKSIIRACGAEYYLFCDLERILED